MYLPEVICLFITIICLFITFVYNIHKEDRGGRSRGHKILANLLMVVHGFLVEGDFLSVVCKDFLHLCDCLVLHYFLGASSIYSSIIERRRKKGLS